MMDLLGLEQLCLLLIEVFITLQHSEGNAGRYQCLGRLIQRRKAKYPGSVGLYLDFYRFVFGGAEYLQASNVVKAHFLWLVCAGADKKWPVNHKAVVVAVNKQNGYIHRLAEFGNSLSDRIVGAEIATANAGTGDIIIFSCGSRPIK